MKEFKKVLAAIMALTMIIGTVPAYAAEEKTISAFTIDLQKDEKGYFVDVDKSADLTGGGIAETLPGSIIAEIDGEEESINVEWVCEDFPKEGSSGGEYVFSAVLPEGYVPAEDTQIAVTVRVPEKEEPEETPRQKSQSRAVKQISIDEENWCVYANGIPIVIDTELDENELYELTYVYDTEGNKLSDIMIENYAVYGGSESISGTAVGDTSVTVKSGNLWSVYGGDLSGERDGDTYINITGGSIKSVYGGSYNGNVNNTHINISGENTLIENYLGNKGNTYGGVVFGGSYYGTAESSTIVFDEAVAGYIYGGSESGGKVKETNIEIKGGTLEYKYFEYNEEYNDWDYAGEKPGYIYGGGLSGPVGDTEIIISGGSYGYVYGGGQDGKAGNTSVTISGGTYTESWVYGGGVEADATVESAHVTLEEGANTYVVCGGGYDGDVNGNVTIDIGNIFSVASGSNHNSKTGYTYVYGGGANSSVVQGNVVVNYDANNLLSGNNRIRVNGDHFSENDSEKRVEGSRTLNLKNVQQEMPPKSTIMMFQLCKNLDMVTIENSAILFSNVSGMGTYSPNKSLEIKQGTILDISGTINLENDLILSGGSIIFRNGGKLTVAGNVDSKKIVDITITTGSGSLSEIHNAPPTASKIELMTGANLEPSQFNITNDGYELVKEGNKIYAIKVTDVPVTLTLDKARDKYEYGDMVRATVSVPMGGGVTTAGTVTMKMDYGLDTVMGNYEQGFVLPAAQTKNIDSEGKAVFEIPLNTAGKFKLIAEFTGGVGEGMAKGSAAETVDVKKKKLSIDPSSVVVRDKEYDGTLYGLDVDFSSAVITGYIRGDSGLELDDDSEGDRVSGIEAVNGSYALDTPDVGNNKPIHSRHDKILTKYYRVDVTPEQEEINKLFYRYDVVPPMLSVNVVRKVVSSIDTNFVLTGKAGAPLSSVTLPNYITGTMTWVNGSQKLTGTKAYAAEFVPNDIVNYDYSRVPGWDGTKVNLSLTVEATKGEAPANKSVAKTYHTDMGEQNISVDLSNINPFEGLDAGNVTYTYIGTSTAKNIKNIAFDAQTKLLTFTLENVTAPEDDMAVLRVRVDSDNYDSAYIDTIISITDKTPVDIEGVTVSSKSYDGLPAEMGGTAVVSGGYDGELEYIWSRGDTILDEAPADAGSYTLTVRVPRSNALYSGSLIIDFNINRREVIVKPADKTVKIGEDLPEVSLSYDTLVDGESVSPANTPTVRYADDEGNAVTNTNRPGAYRIIFDIAPEFDSRGDTERNYTFVMAEGILTVEREAEKPSHGGGGSHSLPQTTTKKDKDEKPAEQERPEDHEGPVIGGIDGLDRRNPFADIENHWAKEDILDAYRQGLLSGTSESGFEPELKVTRGMMAAILFRMSGENGHYTASGFIDVADNMYYSPAVAWGSINNIMSGFDSGLFRPNDEITREQLAVLLFKYAGFMGRDTSNTGGLSMNALSDYEEISDWAQEAVQWCINEGLLSGRTDGSFDPKGSTTRAEAASVVMRFLRE